MVGYRGSEKDDQGGARLSPGCSRISLVDRQTRQLGRIFEIPGGTYFLRPVELRRGTAPPRCRALVIERVTMLYSDKNSDFMKYYRYSSISVRFTMVTC